ncbi:urease accessory protein UreE [Roseobacter sp.]|uniref:urease accessory protein UreE n=1 Tax=Roseobacter sp. TaxID=1907202 RepID=UPI003297CA74
MLTAQKITHTHDADDHVTLDYDARFLRRKVLMTDKGDHVLVDLPKTTSLNAGDAFEATNGTLIGIVAAPEPLLEITGQDLHRIAWHIGNRHTPCQIETDRLLIQQDHVMASMLAQLGAHVLDVVEPFTPEGGAYGHGRTHGHDHSAQHGPDHMHDHGHSHGHSDDD